MQLTDLQITNRRNGAVEWQDFAVNVWNKLKISSQKPNPAWFRFIKFANRGKVMSVISNLSDSLGFNNHQNKEKYFYKVYYSTK